MAMFKFRHFFAGYKPADNISLKDGEGEEGEGRGKESKKEEVEGGRSTTACTPRLNT